MPTSTPAAQDAEASTAAHAGTLPQHSVAALTIGVIGVVFGDIGTSPLYAFREALGQAASDGLIREEILGVMSLMIWALIIVVTLKYVVFLMRADNDGEGGVLALLALAQRGTTRRGGMVLAARSARRCSMAMRSSRPRSPFSLRSKGSRPCPVRGRCSARHGSW